MGFFKKRTANILKNITGKNELQSATSYSVLVCEQGATVKTTGSTSPIFVDNLGDFAANDKFIVGSDTTRFKTVSSVDTSAKSVAYSGDGISVSAGDRLINLGADGGSTEPSYDAGVTIYADIAGNETRDNPITVDAEGEYSYWIAGGQIVDELYRDSSGSPAGNKQDLDFDHEDIETLDNTGTPSVMGGRAFLTGGTTAITDFDDGVTGQIITVIAEHAITITEGTNIFLDDSENFVMAATDTLTLVCKADNKWYELGRSTAARSKLATLGDNATPSVKNGTTFLTGGTTTITDFDDGVTGQIITVVSEHAITITDGTNIFLENSENFVMAATDTLTLICKADNKWYELGRSVAARSKLATLADEATPSVKNGTTFITGGTTTITDFDDGVTGQIITVVAEHSLTITDGTHIFLNGSTNFAMTATDTLTLICKADNKWYEVARADSGA